MQKKKVQNTRVNFNEQNSESLSIREKKLLTPNIENQLIADSLSYWITCQTLISSSIFRLNWFHNEPGITDKNSWMKVVSVRIKPTKQKSKTEMGKSKNEAAEFSSWMKAFKSSLHKFTWAKSKSCYYWIMNWFFKNKKCFSCVKLLYGIFSQKKQMKFI